MKICPDCKKEHKYNTLRCGECIDKQLLDTAEETFKAFINTLPKRILNSWQSIEFDFEGNHIDVAKHHLVETNWDFNNSITVS